ncbi:MAG: calcium/sodium antiporter [Pseudomonadota bacterium]
MALLIVLIGLVLLVLGGDALVRGSVSLSLRMGLSALIVSLTVVAFGTSAPELLISIQAGLDGVPQLAIGNVVGSNTANILLVLGVPALAFGIFTEGTDTRRDFSLMIGASLLFILLCATMPFGPTTAMVLLTTMVAILGVTVWKAQQPAERSDPDGLEGSDDPLWKSIAFLLAGIVALPLGAKLLVDGSIVVATRFGLSEAVIGLTIVAIGTSLPELATTFMAALRKQADVAIGNVLGSNMFNLLLIGGAAAFFGPIEIDPQFLKLDLWIMLAASLAVIPYVFYRIHFTRVWGFVFCFCYAAYMWAIL